MEDDNKAEVINNTNSEKSRRQYVLGGVLLFVGLLIGVVVGMLLSKTADQGSIEISKPADIPPVVNTDPRLLLDPIELLKTPVFTEWGGSVEGEVVEKGDDSFTLAKGGRQLTVYLQESLTGFYRESSDSAELPTEISYDDISVGDYVAGGVTISRETLDNQPDHHIFANVFTVQVDEDQNSQ